MKKGLKITAITFGIFILLAGLWVTNAFIYPFTSSNPNYSDVEKAFAKLQFPSDWQEIKSTENRGLHGRGCDPVNGSGCFHKSKTFKVPENTSVEQVEKVLISGGCTGSVKQDITPQNDTLPTTSLRCGIGSGISFAADLTGPESEVYVSAGTD